MADLRDIYCGYISCLNAQDWDQLGQFVAEDVTRNGRPIGLAGYRDMLERDFEAIPDLRFEIRLLLTDPPFIACELAFDCHPKGMLFGLPVNGRRVRFTENVFYEFRDGRIAAVRSVIDVAAIAAELSPDAQA